MKTKLPKFCNPSAVPSHYRKGRMPAIYGTPYTESNSEYTKDTYTRMGIKVIDEFDEFFYNVELPEGWSIISSNCSQWITVIDKNNRQRIEVFCKNELMEYEAYSNFLYRYSYLISREDDCKSDSISEERITLNIWLIDGGMKVRILSSATYKTLDEYLKRDYRTLHINAENYLNQHFPNWRDICAYWDDKEV